MDKYQSIVIKSNLSKISYLSDEKKMNKILDSLNNCKIVTTNGCYDILHVGHIFSLHQAQKFGDKLVVGLNSDNSVISLKGLERPIRTEIERAEILSSISYVDYVIIFEDLNPINFLKKIKPDIHCKGKDYMNKPDLPEQEAVENLNIQQEFLNLIPNISTTNEIKLINSIK